MLKGFVLIVSIILASACVQNVAPNVTSEVNNQVSAINQSQQEPDIQYPQEQGLGGISTIPDETKLEESKIISFAVEADDKGLYPQTIQVTISSIVNITFKVRTQNVYYGGLDFRSTKFNTGTVKAGGETTVQFTADESFTYTSYWPVSNVIKATGDIIVNQQAI